MQYRRFPHIPDLPVSVLGFGCMRLPAVDGRIDEAAAAALLRHAIDAGVNYVDTAWPYHEGESEPFVGRALSGGYRERVLLATKLPVWLVQDEGDWERLLDRQLTRLQADHLDFYLLHALNAETWETVQRLDGLKAMERARADGRIRHLGFSFHDSLDVFRKVLDGYDWEFCQIQYNFVDTEFQAGAKGLDLAAARGVGVIAMEPIRGGSLARPVPPDIQALRALLRRTPADAALRWVWGHPGIVTALSGMNTPVQLDQNLRSAEAAASRLGPEELDLLSRIAAAYHARIRVPCTGCGYCLPCPQGVAIPDVFQWANAAAMFDDRETHGALYRRLLVEADCGADRCVQCGTCEERCPQGIPVPQRLGEVHGELGE